MAVHLIGIDAGVPAVVDQLAAAGGVPHLAGLLRAGRVASTSNERGLYIGSIWPTYLTGVGVERHGFYTGIRPEPHGYEYVTEPPRAEPFWAAVARAGQRIAVIDVPFFAADPTLGGAQLVEWGCHDRFFGPSSWPPDLLDTVVTRVGRHPIGMLDHGEDRFAPCDWVERAGGPRTADETVRFVATVLDALDHRRRMVDEVLAGQQWDLVVHVVAESHCAGHHLWHLHDPGHPRHDPDLVRHLGGDPLEAIFERIDGIVGRHLAMLAPEDTVFVLLSHGMRPHHDGTYVLDDVLRRLELRYRGEPTAWLGPRTERLRRLNDATARLPARLGRPARRLLGSGVRASLARRDAGPTNWEPLPHPSERIWWRIENNTESGAMRFNVVGRERDGTLPPDEVPRATAWVRDRLLDLVNVATGEPVVTAVFETADLYERRPDDGLPDLIVEWNRRAPIESIWSPDVGHIVRPDRELRFGEHDRFGRLVGRGPGITPGDHGEVRPVDVGPTVAAAAGVALTDVDGRPAFGATT